MQFTTYTLVKQGYIPETASVTFLLVVNTSELTLCIHWWFSTKLSKIQFMDQTTKKVEQIVQ